MQKLRVGFIVNPIAGLGGSVALKGTDGESILQQAKALGAQPMSPHRASKALSVLLPYQAQMEVFSASSGMGYELAKEMGFISHEVYRPASDETCPSDTESAIRAMAGLVDLILFAGGDGTARNICHQLEELEIEVPVIGIPAGCKIHSGVYAITPKAAGLVVEKMLKGELVSIQQADVMDIDESQFRDGIVKAKRYGEMTTPCELQYIQQVKMGGKESEELVLDDLAAFIVDEMEVGTRYVMGSGSTVAAVMETLGVENTLLGVDIIEDEQLVASDVTASQLIELTQGRPTKLIITLIGGQGHIFGRGNQQLSPSFIRQIGKENIMILATKQKIQALEGRPLIADTGDEQLDQALSGLMKVVTGYQDYVMYHVGMGEKGC
ncbi:ATP-NAD kinase family protein [Algicola sagamiensis]|uniref:ATP-NAD kinase family protein n=1 Tax=Algicola sagamiensis TaxID=163869 RepID=UPI00037A0D0D|nr:ATP-NAD kinase family protein [Algicola sagamiensis]